MTCIRDHAFFNFIAPSGKADGEHNVLFPVSDIQTKEDAAVIAVEVKQMVTVVNVDQMAADATINLTIDSQVTPGAILLLRLQSDGTARDVTPGTGMEGNDVAGVISKTKVATYIYDGTNFVHIATQQID